MKNLKQQIQQEGFISKEIRSKELRNLSIFEIRDWLEDNGLDRHMPIECISTEIAICTPKGILMQVRAMDNNKLGMWGGVVEVDETPIKCAVRELLEETGIKVSEEQLNFIEVNQHTHTYANGDKGIFISHRYILRFDYVPEVMIDYESNGFHLISSTYTKDVELIIDHQKDFILNLIM